MTTRTATQKICPHCGLANTDQRTLCKRCHASLDQVKPVPVPSPLPARLIVSAIGGMLVALPAYFFRTTLFAGLVGIPSAPLRSFLIICGLSALVAVLMSGLRIHLVLGLLLAFLASFVGCQFSAQGFPTHPGI